MASFAVFSKVQGDASNDLPRRATQTAPTHQDAAQTVLNASPETFKAGQLVLVGEVLADGQLGPLKRYNVVQHGFVVEPV